MYTLPTTMNCNTAATAGASAMPGASAPVRPDIPDVSVLFASSSPRPNRHASSIEQTNKHRHQQPRAHTTLVCRRRAQSKSDSRSKVRKARVSRPNYVVIDNSTDDDVENEDDAQSNSSSRQRRPKRKGEGTRLQKKCRKDTSRSCPTDGGVGVCRMRCSFSDDDENNNNDSDAEKNEQNGVVDATLQQCCSSTNETSSGNEACNTPTTLIRQQQQQQQRRNHNSHSSHIITFEAVFGQAAESSDESESQSSEMSDSDNDNDRDENKEDEWYQRHHNFLLNSNINSNNNNDDNNNDDNNNKSKVARLIMTKHELESTKIDVSPPSATKSTSSIDSTTLAEPHSITWPPRVIALVEPRKYMSPRAFNTWLNYMVNEHLGGWDVLEGSEVKRGNGKLHLKHVGLSSTAGTGQSSNGSEKEKAKQSSAQYGRANPALILKVRELTGLNSSHNFTDLGSGIGQVVLQMSAIVGCQSFGLELLEGRHAAAKLLDKWFQQYAGKTDMAHGSYRLEHGDFTNVDFKERILQSDVLFANNAHNTFGVRSHMGKGPLLNESFASLALRLKRGAYVVTLDTVPELDIYHQTGAIQRNVHTFTGEDLVSWQGSGHTAEIELYVYRKISDDWGCTHCSQRNFFVFWDGKRISCNTMCANPTCHNTKMPNLRNRR